MSKVIHLTEENYDLETSEGVSLVDFWAPWCGPCRMIGSTIEDLAEEFDGKAKICKVNTDEQQNLSVKHGIRSIPTIFFIKNGEIVDTVIGADSKENLKNKIESIL